jgi:hypothetical protein
MIVHTITTTQQATHVAHSWFSARVGHLARLPHENHRHSSREDV